MEDPKKFDGQQRRDTLLLRLLKTPPQPRPKRERGDDRPSKEGKDQLQQEAQRRKAKTPSK